jgi:hypothetical protein
MHKIILAFLILTFSSLSFAKETQPAVSMFASFLDNPPTFDVKEANTRFGQVKESLLWVTDKKTVNLYKTSALKGGTPLNLPMVPAEKNKGRKPVYYGQQEFNDSGKTFIFKDKAIKMLDGWVKREDFVPFNVLSRQYEADKFFTQYFIVRRCPEVLKAKLAKINNGISFEDYLSKQDMLYRSYEIGYCATTSELECKSTVANLKVEIDRKNCPELFRAK